MLKNRAKYKERNIIMIEKITLSNIQAHQSEPAYQFLMQALNDLWENYMYNEQDLNDADVDRVDTEDVGYFREWCDAQGFFAIEHCLPESDTLIQEIIKFCLKQVNDWHCWLIANFIYYTTPQQIKKHFAF